MYVCMYVFIYVCMYVCMYVCIYVCVYVCMYVYMYVNVYVCAHAYMYLVKKTDNVSSRRSPIRQWPHVNSCTCARDAAGVILENEGSIQQRYKRVLPP